MSRQSSAYAYLAFWGEEFSPQEFSVFIGLQATFSRVKGEKSKSGIPAKECLWQYECGSTDDCTGLDESLGKLHVLFSERTVLIQQFMLTHHLQARCTVVLTIREKENPGIRLSPQFILFLTEIGAGFELDGYQ